MSQNTIGLTPREFAKQWRVSPNRVRNWIHSGLLSAVNVAAFGQKARFIILPEHVEDFKQNRQVKKPAKTVRKVKNSGVDFFPD